MICMSQLSCCNLPSAPSAMSGPVFVWVAFLSPVLALACPCGRYHNETPTDLLTQPRGQSVTMLWIWFSRLSSPLFGLQTQEARQLALQIESWTLNSLRSSIDILGSCSSSLLWTVHLYSPKSYSEHVGPEDRHADEMESTVKVPQQERSRAPPHKWQMLLPLQGEFGLWDTVPNHHLTGWRRAETQTS